MGRGRFVCSAVLVAASLLLVLGPGTASGRPDERASSREAAARGAEHLNAERWAEAEAALREAVSRWSENATALNNLAWLQLTRTDPGQRDAREAASLGERAVALDPDRHAFLDTLATAYDALGRPFEAARLELRAARLATEVAFYREQLLAFAGRAQARLPAAAVLARAEAGWLLAEGHLLAAAAAKGAPRNEAAGAALRTLEEACRLAPDHARAHEARGRALEELGRAAPAVEALDRARSLGLDEAGLERRLGDLLLRLGRRAEGTAALVRAAAAAPGDAALQLRVVRLWIEEGRPHQASAAVRTAIAALRQHPPLWLADWERRLHEAEAEAWEAELRRIQAADTASGSASAASPDAIGGPNDAPAAAGGMREDAPVAGGDTREGDARVAGGEAHEGGPAAGGEAREDAAAAGGEVREDAPAVGEAREDGHAAGGEAREDGHAAGGEAREDARRAGGEAREDAAAAACDRREDAHAPTGAASPASAARERALHALVRASAARATNHGLDARIVTHARALSLAPSGAKALEPALRARLAGSVLGQRDVPALSEVPGAIPSGVRGRRLAFGDVDLDGDPDLIVDGRSLLLNDGAGQFSSTSAIPRGGSLGGVLADMDRDGDLDLYAFGHGAGGDRLLRNELGPEGARFVNVTEAYGAPVDDLPSEGAAWGDLDGDGYPDLVVANYELPGEPLRRGTPDRLWLNEGGARFRSASERVASTPPRCGRGVSLADVDQDGDTDVLVSNYRLDPNLLWINDGRGQLREEGEARGVAGDRVRNAWGHTIGSAWGDLDLDGDLDLVVSNLAHPRFIAFSEPTSVLLQGAEGRFSAAAGRAGIAFEETHSHPTLFDLEDDGDLDLFLTSTYAGRPSSLWRNRAVEDGALSFEDVTWAAGARLFNGWGAAAADVDGDGDQDLALTAGGDVRLLVNAGAPSRAEAARRRSVRVRLRGTRSGTWGQGATATLQVGPTRALVRQVQLGHGTGCQSEPLLHFGVGAAPGPFTLTVRWPSGARSDLELGPGLHEVREEPR